MCLRQCHHFWFADKIGYHHLALGFVALNAACVQPPRMKIANSLFLWIAHFISFLLDLSFSLLSFRSYIVGESGWLGLFSSGLGSMRLCCLWTCSFLILLSDLCSLFNSLYSAVLLIIHSLIFFHRLKTIHFFHEVQPDCTKDVFLFIQCSIVNKDLDLVFLRLNPSNEHLKNQAFQILSLIFSNIFFEYFCHQKANIRTS